MPMHQGIFACPSLEDLQLLQVDESGLVKGDGKTFDQKQLSQLITETESTTVHTTAHCGCTQTPQIHRHNIHIIQHQQLDRGSDSTTADSDTQKHINNFSVMENCGIKVNTTLLCSGQISFHQLPFLPHRSLL